MGRGEGLHPRNDLGLGYPPLCSFAGWRSRTPGRGGRKRGGGGGRGAAKGKGGGKTRGGKIAGRPVPFPVSRCSELHAKKVYRQAGISHPPVSQLPVHLTQPTSTPLLTSQLPAPARSSNPVQVTYPCRSSPRTSSFFFHSLDIFTPRPPCRRQVTRRRSAMSYFTASPAMMPSSSSSSAFVSSPTIIQGFQPMTPQQQQSSSSFHFQPQHYHSHPHHHHHHDIFGGHAHEFTSTWPLDASTSSASSSSSSSAVRRAPGIAAASASPYGSSPAVSRRQRVAMACTYCRKRKIRCDGLETCTNCVRSRRLCHYEPVPPEVNKTRPPRNAAAPNATPSQSQHGMFDFYPGSFTASPLVMATGGGSNPWSTPQEATFAFQPTGTASSSSSSLMPPISISPAHVHPHAGMFASPPSLTRSSSPTTDDSSDADSSIGQQQQQQRSFKRSSTDSLDVAAKRPRITTSLTSPPYTPYSNTTSSFTAAATSANPQLLTPMAPSHAMFNYMNAPTGPGAVFTPALTPMYKHAASPDMTLTQPIAGARFPMHSIKTTGPIGLGISMPSFEQPQPQMAAAFGDDVFRVAPQEQFVHNGMIYPTA